VGDDSYFAIEFDEDWWVLKANNEEAVLGAFGIEAREVQSECCGYEGLGF